MDKIKKAEIVTTFGENEKDTGSASVQIALLSTRINEITEHLKTHPKDKHTRRGMYKLVGQRRGLLRYLQKTDIAQFRKIKEQLGIR